MSALGQKRTCAVQKAMSALVPIADIKPWPLLAGRRGAMTTAHTQQQTIASQDRVLVGTLSSSKGEQS